MSDEVEHVWHLDVSANALAPIVHWAWKMMQNPILMLIGDRNCQHPARCDAAMISSVDFRDVREGWLFCRSGEVHWRKLDTDLVRLVYLGGLDGFDGFPLLEPPKADQVGTLHRSESRLLAWGHRHGQTWREGTVAPSFEYPLGSGQPSDGGGYRAFFVIFRYQHPASGALLYWRHAGFEYAL
jgi:hypothetical protein